MASILQHPHAQTLLDQATLEPAQVRACAARLRAFLLPYADCFARAEQRHHAHRVVHGLLSALPRKTAEPIARHAGVDRKPIQHFLGAGAWDDDAVLRQLRSELAARWGDDPQAVLTVDASAFAKKGADSCGVARQWCGRLGKVDNCQVGVFVSYACRHGHTLIDRRLYLPDDWAADTDRRTKTHVPAAVVYQESWRIAVDLLDRCRGVRHGWISADDEFGRVQEFRAALRERGERYLVDVPANTVVRDLDEAPPEQPRRHGSPPKQPFESVAAWAARQPAGRWQRVRVRAGEKGWVEVEALTARVQTTYQRSLVGPEERLLVRRNLGSAECSYHLSNAGPAVPLAALVRARGRHHDVEQCFQEGKGEVGLGQYEVRSWVGWHHHMTLCLLALWFVAQERERLGQSGTHLSAAQVRQILSRLQARPRPMVAQIVAEINAVLRRTEEARIYAWFHEHGCYPPPRNRAA